MRQGYAFTGTGAAAPTADNVTFYDPILRTDVSSLTIRGDNRKVRIDGLSFADNAPDLGSRLELRIGNQPTDVRVIDVLPILDGDLVSDKVHMMNYIDLGGIMVNEDELIDIRLYDPGAAELFAGVLWVEDFEPQIPIPSGQMVTLLFGGANDVTTAIAATGFDMDSRKLINERVYTPFMVDVRPENSLMEGLWLQAGKDVMTLPQCGRMIYDSAPIQFTGQEYNSGFVVGKAIAQAAGKFEAVMYLIESEGERDASAGAPNVETVVSDTPPSVFSIKSVFHKLKKVSAKAKNRFRRK